MSAPLPAGYEQTEVGVIPGDWEVVSLGKLSEFITSGSRGWARYYSDRGALFVRSQNVRDGQLDFADRQFVNPPLGAEGNRTRLNRGDLLITITGNSVGNVAFVEQELGEAYISQHVGLVRLLEPSGGPYICRFLAPGSIGNEQIFASQSGQSKPGLSLKNLQEFLVALPPIPEQRAIAAALSDVDVLLAKLDEFIAKKRDIKQAAMQQLLTGQTRLPGFSGEWEVKRLGDLFAFSGGHTASRDQLSDTGYCYLHYGDIHLSKKTFIDVEAEFLEIPKLVVSLSDVSTASILNDGDVVFVDASEDDEGTSKHVVVVNQDDRPYISGLHTIVAKSKANRINNLFKRYCFQTRNIKEQFRFFAVGTKVSGISKTSVAKVELHFPPSLEEQTAIATILSDMDSELSALEARRDKTNALKQGMMQELLTGRIRLV